MSEMLVWGARRRSGRLALVAALSGAVAAMAVGSSVASASSTAIAAKATIKIMAMSVVGNPVVNDPGVFADAISAADAANASGVAGKGRRIQIVTCNAQGTQNGETACAREAVADKVVAVVGYSGYVNVIAPILAKAKIPLEPLVFESSFLTLPDVYSVDGTGSLGEYPGMAAIAAKLKAKKVALLYGDFPGIQQNVTLETNLLQKDGISFATPIPMSLSTVDFSGLAAQVKATGADTVLVSGGPNLAGLMEAAQQIGYTPNWVIPTAAFNLAQLKSVGNLTSRLYLSAFLPVFLHGGKTPYVSINLMRQQVSKYGGSNGALSHQDETSLYAWYSTEATINVIGQITGKVTAASYTAQLHKTKNLSVEGFWNWTPKDIYPNVPAPRVFFGHASSNYASYQSASLTVPVSSLK